MPLKVCIKCGVYGVSDAISGLWQQRAICSPVDKTTPVCNTLFTLQNLTFAVRAAALKGWRFFCCLPPPTDASMTKPLPPFRPLFLWPLAAGVLLALVISYFLWPQHWVHKVGDFFSHLGYNGLIVVAAGLLLWRAFRAGPRLVAWWLLADSLLTPLCVEGLKAITRLPRPRDQDGHVGLNGFPSGHTTYSFALAWLLTQIHPRLAPLWYLWAVTIGWSRIEGGAHFRYQVLAGAALGTGIAWAITHGWPSVRKPRPAAGIAGVLALALLALLLLGAPAWAAAPTRPPNELGRIPILMYHSVGGEAEFAGGPRYDKHGLNIAPDTLRRQLALMSAANWYPVNMRDLLSARLSVPRGKTPVVLTFDDARPSQFRLLPNGKIDPSCAVGILEAFHAQHPDWPRRATFYVLPESAYNGVPFDQDGLETKKLRFLVRAGYELGNHTTSHRSLADLSVPTLRWEMAFCARYFRHQAPGLRMTTMALPYGIAPHDPARWRVLMDGTQGGTQYHEMCLLLAKGGPSFAPADRRFDPRRVPRVEAVPGEIECWLLPEQAKRLYVSDGSSETVTVPAAQRPFVLPRRLDGARLIISR